MRAAARVLLVVLLGVGIGGCGSDIQPVDSSENRSQVGDAKDFFRAVADLRSVDLNVIEPRSVLDALPNREISVRTGDREVLTGFSSVVAAGRVTEVAPGEGLRYPNDDPTSTANEEAEIEVLKFGDARADERNVLVTMAVAWSAGEEVGDTVSSRIGVPAEADPDEFLAGLRDLDRIVVILDEIVTGRHVGSYYPVLRGAGLAGVGSAGQLHFGGLGADEEAFLLGVHSLEELMAEAERPTVSVAY